MDTASDPTSVTSPVSLPSRERWRRGILWALMCGGLGVAAWPCAQGAYAWWSQRALEDEWRRAWHEEARRAPTPPRKYLRPASRVAKSKKRRAKTATRWVPTRIVIPSVDVDAIVVRGVDEASLRRGPGHDPASAMPGQRGNCVIAGHRNSYGWWFYPLGRLGTAARIDLRTPRATYVYALASTRIVRDTDTHVLRAPRDREATPRLTLYTCALPHGSKRVVITANLVRVEKPAR